MGGFSVPFEKLITKPDQHLDHPFQVQLHIHNIPYAVVRDVYLF